MYFIMTNDVELHSFSLNKEDPLVANQIYKEGLPRLLGLLSKYDIQSTFYFTGTFTELSPQSIELVKDHGHEIGCHGYDHSPQKAFDLLSYTEQVEQLIKAKKTIEPIAGKITSFRAPALRINEDTVKALEYTGFTTDSSIASQRFDGPFTFGSRRKLKWLNAPRKPYHMSYESTVKKGNSKIMEIPISAMFFPYIGTLLRISPNITRTLEKLLYYESKNTEKPIVFLFHPTELLDPEKRVATTRRSSNPVEYLFADVLRQRLKLRNMGDKAVQLLDKLLKTAVNSDFEFTTIREYNRIHGKCNDDNRNSQFR